MPGLVVFDTSSLGLLAKSDLRRGEFEDVLNARDCRPAHALSTSQSLIGNPSKVRGQFAALARLGFGRFPMLVMQHGVQRAEAEMLEISGAWLYAWDLANVFDAADDEQEFSEYLTPRQDYFRRTLVPPPPEKTDRLLAWWHALPESERRKRKRLFGGVEISEDVIGPRGFVTRRAIEGSRGEGYADRAFADPQNHRSNLAMGGLLSLYLIGTLMHGEHTPAFPWLKSERDDRTDVNIVAQAAYCDLFVTDDGNLRQRLEFLRGRGCVYFDVMTLAEFLGREPPAA